MLHHQTQAQVFHQKGAVVRVEVAPGLVTRLHRRLPRQSKTYLKLRICPRLEARGIKHALVLSDSPGCERIDGRELTLLDRTRSVS
jgi:hypothetical protein